MKITVPNETGNAVGVFVFAWEERLTAIVRLLFARAVSPGTGPAATSSRYVSGLRPVVSQENNKLTELPFPRFRTNCDPTLVLLQ